LYSFQPYTHKHVIVVAVLVGTIALVCTVARSIPARYRARLEPILGLILLAIWAATAGAHFSKPSLSLQTSLPLHWCDLTGILAGVVLLRPAADTRAALHFWGLCFTSLAFLAPVEARGPIYPAFWFYFVSHGAILLAVAYDAIVRGYVPTAGDLKRTALVTAAWVAAVTPFNVLLGANYAYVGNSATGQRVIVEALPGVGDADERAGAGAVPPASPGG
jgi:hypothetical integral membrane protein (TIGR02206 family)